MITKSTNDFSNLDFAAGETILIDKPSGWSSFKIVNQIRKTVNVKKVGHAGTLDPAATGLLIICTGKKTKELSNYLGLSKTYEGTILLGKSSPSMDAETEFTEQRIPENLNIEKVASVSKQFLGEVEQIPPMYSALKINGKKLYELARKGKVIERKPRKIFIEDFNIKKINIPEIDFGITCSKGTYIRVIADDFGKKLETGAILKNLRRTKIGTFDVNDALTIDEFISRCSAVNSFKLLF